LTQIQQQMADTVKLVAPALSAAGAEDLKNQSFIRIGDTAPDFEAEWQGEGTIRWHEYIEGSWAILFSHPRDYTPVCTTEIGEVAKLKEEWAKRGVKTAVVSVDDAKSHKGWAEEINRLSNVTIDFPIFADESKKISLAYGMLDPTHINQAGMPLSVRSVFIIGPDKKVKLTLTYPASCGRNFSEIIRVVDSLQLTANKYVATPANWTPGDKVVLLPVLDDEQIGKLFPNVNVDVVSSSCKLRMVQL